MNTANPQLEGLYLALSAILTRLADKGILSHQELRETLAATEPLALSGGALPSDSDAHRKAMAFPIRLLILASEAAERGETPDFRSLAREVGQTS